MNFDTLAAILLAGTVGASNVQAASGAGGPAPVEVIATAETLQQARVAALAALRTKHRTIFGRDADDVIVTACPPESRNRSAFVLVASSAGGSERSYATLGSVGPLVGQMAYGAVMGGGCDARWPQDFRK